MRDIPKAIGDYERITEGQDKFFLTDIAQIYDLAEDPKTGKADTCRAIGKALQAGFTVGYRYAKRGKK